MPKRSMAVVSSRAKATSGSTVDSPPTPYLLPKKVRGRTTRQLGAEAAAVGIVIFVDAPKLMMLRFKFSTLSDRLSDCVLLPPAEISAYEHLSSDGVCGLQVLTRQLEVY